MSHAWAGAGRAGEPWAADIEKEASTPVIIDSETPEFEAHRLIYARCGAMLTPAEWCDQIGVWVEGHEGRWFKRLCELSSEAPDRAAFEAEKRRLFQDLVSLEPMRG